MPHHLVFKVTKWLALILLLISLWKWVNSPMNSIHEYLMTLLHLSESTTFMPSPCYYNLEERGSRIATLYQEIVLQQHKIPMHERLRPSWSHHPIQDNVNLQPTWNRPAHDNHCFEEDKGMTCTVQWVTVFVSNADLGLRHAQEIFLHNFAQDYCFHQNANLVLSWVIKFCPLQLVLLCLTIPLYFNISVRTWH